jgi:hypothetical protein
MATSRGNSWSATKPAPVLAGQPAPTLNLYPLRL